MFFAVILITLGLSILLNALFGWHLPFFRLAAGAFIIFLGVKVLVGPNWKYSYTSKITADSVAFTEGRFEPKSIEDVQEEYSVAFGKGTIDLRGLPKQDREIDVKVSSAFGETVILVPLDSQIRTKMSAFAGKIELPEEIAPEATPPSSETANRYRFHLDTAFGKIRVVRR